MNGQTVASVGVSTIQSASQPTQPSEAIHTEEPALLALKSSILANRGATYPERYHPKNLISPTLLTDGVKAATRLADALMKGQRVVCVADFDCDGATSAAILIRGLSRLSDALTKTLKSKPATLDHVVPDRFKYGYGLKPRLAEEAIRPLAPDLIVTLDNGISSHDAVDRIATWTDVSAASPTGAPDVIITDHHAQGDSIPKAFAVVNPNRKDCQFPSKALAGCGVAFYMVMLTRQALITRLNRMADQHPTGNPNSRTAAKLVSAIQMSHLADLVAVGTVGDLVPLDSNNRLLVKTGLDRINKGWQMPARKAHQEGYLSFGVRALLEAANAQYPITTSDLAFQVCPRINAVGRLEKPIAGVACLLSETQMIAGIEAKTCNQLNEERKKIQREMQVEADQQLAALSFDADHLLAEGNLAETGAAGEVSDDTDNQDGQQAVILHDDTWHPGIVGLIASRIKEKTRGAVICFSPEMDPSAEPGTPEAEGDPDWLKGSGRSDNVNIRDAVAYVVARAPDMLIQFGGHARAMGCSLHRSELRRFTRLFNEAVHHLLRTAPLYNPEYHDGTLPADLRTHRFAAWIERQPWGQYFPEPTFTQTFKVIRTQPVGTEHQRLLLIDADDRPLVNHEANADALSVYPAASGAQSINMVWFFSRNQSRPSVTIPDHLTGMVDDLVLPDGAVEAGAAVRVSYQLIINRFRGANNIQGIIRSLEVIGRGQ